MSYFAEIDKDGIVQRVIVADQKFINSGAVGAPANWVETFIDGSQRKNYAGKGHVYNKALDGFVPPKKFASWVLNTNTCRYEAPVAMPVDGSKYLWDEASKSWVTFSVLGDAASTAVSIDNSSLTLI